MVENILAFLAHWAITALSLWVASFIFRGITFSDKRSLFISALLLGLANAIIRPVLVLLTIPLTILTFGFFLLVINALMVLLVSSVVPGFKVSGFWTAFFASIFITLLSFFVGTLLSQGSGQAEFVPARGELFVQESPAPQEKIAFRPLPERPIYITMRGAVPLIQQREKTSMNRKELVEALADKTGSSKAEADRTIGAVIDIVTGALKKGDNVALVGFGTFEVRKRAARKGRNPATGEAIKIKAAKVPAFRAGAGLKAAVNK